MNQLRGRYVNVVLGIEEGKGLDFVKSPLHIAANFNGRILESDPVNSEESPSFNTQLVWEVEKKDLRNIRCTNSPLKIECFTTDSNEKQIRIGFILLSLRSAHILPDGNSKQPPFKWEKLMGVPHEHKNFHSELYLSLMIKDNIDLTNIDETEDVCNPFIAEKVEDHELEMINDTEVQSKIPIKYLEGGYIQVGNTEENLYPYCLNITVKVAANLDVLLPEAYVFSQMRDKYYISFSLFGISIKSKPFNNNLHSNILLNEKIVVNLWSNFETLKEFFTQHHEILVYFNGGENKLGMTKINVGKLLKDITEVEFQNIHHCSIDCQELCNFRFPSPNGIIPESINGRIPFLEVTTILEQKTIKRNKLDSAKGAEKLRTVTSSLEKVLKYASGDAAAADMSTIKLIKKTHKKAQSTLEMHPKRKTDQKSTKSTENILKGLPYISPRELPLASSKTDVKTPQIMLKYKRFCLDILLEKIKWKKLIQENSFQIKFKHPKSVNFLSFKQKICPSEDTVIHSAKCRMFFISTPSHIKRLVSYWPPKLAFYNEQENIIGETDIPTGLLLCDDGNKCSHKVELETSNAQEPLADVYLTIHLQECDTGKKSKQPQFDLVPEILDEQIVVEQLDDLNKWNRIHKKKFEEELNVLKSQRLAELECEWKQKKDNLETKLKRNVKKCKVLIQKLKIATNSLRIHQALDKKKNEQSGTFEDEVDKRINKYSSLEYRQLVEKIYSLEQENSNLREIIAEQTEKIQAVRKSALTKEQTSNLLKELRILEEQFEDAQRQKSYFKEQWKKAVHEIHELRTEDHKQIFNQIQINKEELSQLSLDNNEFDIDKINDGEILLYD